MVFDSFHRCSEKSYGTMMSCKTFSCVFMCSCKCREFQDIYFFLIFVMTEKLCGAGFNGYIIQSYSDSLCNIG